MLLHAANLVKSVVDILSKEVFRGDLMAIVEGSFKLDPFSEALFVFCNRNRDRLKILEFDGDGFWLFFKRLDKGHFKWPAEGETATMVLSGEELATLLGGVRVELKIRRNEVKERAIS
jgi:transposase